MGRPWGIFFGFYKTRHILISDNANRTVLRAVVLAKYRLVTDGRTDGRTDGQTADEIAVASTALVKMMTADKTADVQMRERCLLIWSLGDRL